MNLEKLFHLKENHTDVKTEIMAGITTFMTMAYILAVNPNILSAAGMDRGAVFTATALSSFIATCLMALLSNYPFVLAPGMGLNAYFAYTVVLGMGYSWQQALVAVFVEGIIFIILSCFNIREAIVNALVHRDYSMHTEGMPIQLILFEDRMEIRNPGGIYGRIRADKLGKVQPDTRNPVLASALEVLGMTENRYSGIPTIRKVMQESGLPQPVFCDERGSFVVTFRKEMPQAARASDPHAAGSLAGALVSFCETPRTREEICTFLDLKSSPYVVKEYVLPLVESGNLRMTIPDKPRSSKQRYVAAENAR